MYTVLYAMAWLNRSYQSNVPEAIPHSYDVTPLAVPTGSVIFVGIMLIAVLPAIAIAVGVIIRYKRKNKRA